MALQFFVSCWGNEADIAGAVALAKEWGADGVEGPLPHDRLACVLRDSGLPWIAEVTTGGGYVPRPHLSVSQHLDDFYRQVEASLPLTPLLINVLGGSDAWSFGEKVAFYAKIVDAGRELRLPIAVETHRSRPTFHPWATRDLLQELPDLRVTCDFSHWCAVCERLVMDEEPALMDLLARRVLHIHGRVGYDQGPQVPDPRAPEYLKALDAHVSWWQRLAHGKSCLTMTPEFGPDGYLQSDPFTRKPVADLREINRWMMGHLKDVMGDAFSSYD